MARQQGAVWLYGDTLTVEFVGEPLAHYAVAYQPDHRHFRTVTNQRLLDTRFRSPQLALWDLGPDDWHLVLRLPEPPPRRRREPVAMQPRLFPPGEEQVASS